MCLTAASSAWAGSLDGGNASEPGAISIGPGSEASDSDAVAIGKGARSAAWGSTAVGAEVVIEGHNSVGTGSYIHATTAAFDNALIGTKISSTNHNVIGIGNEMRIDSGGSVVLATYSQLTQEERDTGGRIAADLASTAAVVLGYNAQALGAPFGMALGAGATVTARESVAIGHGATTTSDLSAAAYAPGSAPVVGEAGGEVSFGNDAQRTLAWGPTMQKTQRRLTNVAAGAADTDAVNVSQLKSLAKSPLRFTGNDNSAGPVTRVLGDSVQISGLSTAAGTYSGNNLRTVADPATGALHLQMADAPKFGNVVINDSGKISGVSAGTAPSDVVNVSQLNDAGWNIQANGTTADLVKKDQTVNFIDGTNTIATYDAGTKQMKYSIIDAPTFAGPLTLNGGMAVAAGQTVNMGGNKVQNVAAGTDDTDAVNLRQLEEREEYLNETGLNFGANSGPNVHMNLGGTFLIAGGASTAGSYSSGNLRTVTTANGVELQMADSPKFGAMTINDQGRITGVAAGVGATDVVNVSQLTQVQNTAELGWNMQANSGTNGAGNIGPGETVNVVNGSNTTVSFDGSTGQLRVDVVENPTFSGTVTADGGLVVNNELAVGANSNVDIGGNQIHNVAAGAADTDAVNMGQLRGLQNDVAGQMGGMVKYDQNPDGSVNYNSVTLNQGGTPTTITNVAPGVVSAVSTDVINGAQLYEVQRGLGNVANTVNNFAGDQSESYTQQQGRGIRYVRTNDGGLPMSDASAQGQGSTAVGYEAKATGDNALALGRGAEASEANSVALGAGSKTAPTVATTKGTVGGSTHQFAGGAPTGTVSVGDKGGERTVTNVAAGRIEADSTDAINGSQLYATNEQVNENTQDIGNINQQLGQNANAINKLDNKLGGLKRDANAGSASAMAVAGLPQAVLPGKGMFSLAGSTYEGESALALGVSKLSDSGKWVVKAGVTSNTRGNYGATVGAGFHF